ncbi:hypothetical protein SB758_33035, partial [Burkholderia sp. SIMBA_013]
MNKKEIGRKSASSRGPKPPISPLNFDEIRQADGRHACLPKNNTAPVLDLVNACGVLRCATALRVTM